MGGSLSIQDRKSERYRGWHPAGGPWHSAVGVSVASRAIPFSDRWRPDLVRVELRYFMWSVVDCSISNCYDYVLQFPGSVSSPKLCWSELILVSLRLFVFVFFILAHISIFYSFLPTNLGTSLIWNTSKNVGDAFNQSGTWGYILMPPEC